MYAFYAKDVPADQFAFYADRGKLYCDNAFGAVTGTNRHFQLYASATLGSSAQGRVLDITAVPNSSDLESASWYGIYATCLSTAGNAKKYAFYAPANWEYSLWADGGEVYVKDARISNETDLDEVSLSVNGLINIETDNTTAITTSGARLMMRMYHTRNASDTDGSLYFYYAEADSTSGSLDLLGLRLGSNLDRGIYSTSGYSRLQRTAATWTGTGHNVLEVYNFNTATDAAGAIEARIAQVASGVWCVEMQNTAQSSTTEGTANHLGFSSAETNKRNIPIQNATPHSLGSGTSSEDFYLVSTGIGSTASIYWITNAVANNQYIDMPLELPHKSTIQEIQVRQSGGGGSATGLNLPCIALYRKQFSASSAVRLSGPTYAASTGSSTITMSSIAHTVDNTDYCYFVRYRNVATGAASSSYFYSVSVEYDITDLGAAPGF
jgi:hypothetical protein